MAYQVKMPKFGETMTEGVICAWYKKDGEEVKKGDLLFQIETDKSTLDVESEYEGILLKIIMVENETVPIGEVVAIIGEEGETITDLGEKETDYKDVAEESKQEDKIQAEEVNGGIIGTETGKVKASPAARKLAGDHGLELSEINPRGKDIINIADVKAYIDNNKSLVSTIGTKELISDPDLGSETEQIPLTGMRKVIADRMSRSYREAPHVTLTTKVDMSRIVELRKTLWTKLEEHITYTDIITLFTARALREYPDINCHLRDEKLVIYKRVNMGIAVDLGKGLIVPVIRNADRLNIQEIALYRERIVKKAREGQLKPDETTGGTFTITNLGNYDIDIFTPIINPPEVAILGIGKIRKEPVVIEEKIEFRPVMWVSLSFDHRAVDGALAARFLKRIKELFEEPGMYIL